MKKTIIFLLLFLVSCTSSGSTDPETIVRFIAVGDTGTGDSNQQAVADAMAAKCEASGCDFALLLGDNFYEAGVTGTDDPLWQSYFEVPYAALDIPFYALLGNHDYDGNETAEIEYSALSDKWMMPDRYYDFEESPVKFFILDSNNFDSDQVSWLADQLDTSTATFKIVAFHHPLYTDGPHGDDSAGIAASLVPVICDNITLILSGHDHAKEDIVDSTDGCSFRQMVIGSGGKSLYEVTPNDRQLFAASTFGFGYFEVTEDLISFEFIDVDGNVEYEGTIE